MNILFGFIGTILIVLIGIAAYFIGYSLAGFLYETIAPKKGRLKLEVYTNYLFWILLLSIGLFVVIGAITGKEGLEFLANYWR